MAQGQHKWKETVDDLYPSPSPSWDMEDWMVMRANLQESEPVLFSVFFLFLEYFIMILKWQNTHLQFNPGFC